MSFVAKKIFLTKGVGKHRERLSSFELALRNAGIAACNIVRVSSIFPPNCKLISRSEGLKHIKPGQVAFTVISENSTKEAHRLIAKDSRNKDVLFPYLNGEDLRIHAVFADAGPTIKRFRPRAMGRATRIRKRTSHLTITLTPKD